MKLKVLNLEVCLGDNHILKGVSIDVEKKEFVGIIGPNGSGKSTLLKCIYRKLKPNRGSILVDDKDINKFSLKETARIFSVMSQINNYNFDFKVLDMVLMGRAPHKSFIERDNAFDYEIAREALKKVGMEDYFERSFLSLSGGEKQRIILARVLAQETPGLILDEPTNHLDIKYQLQLMGIVKELNKTVVAAIHDLNIAAMYCDKIYAMKSGKIFKHGAPKEVLTRDVIKELYDVEADITEDNKTGVLNIKYKPTYV